MSITRSRQGGAGLFHARLTDDAYAVIGSPRAFGSAGDLKLAAKKERKVISFIKFDLSDLPLGRTGRDVTRATLTVWVNAVSSSGRWGWAIVKDDWSESLLTGKNSPSLGPTAARFTVSAGQSNFFFEIDVTRAVAAWVDRKAPNYGVALLPVDSSVSVSFDSKENTATSHEPTLEILLGHVFKLLEPAISGRVRR